MNQAKVKFVIIICLRINISLRRGKRTRVISINQINIPSRYFETLYFCKLFCCFFLSQISDKKLLQKNNFPQLPSVLSHLKKHQCKKFPRCFFSFFLYWVCSLLTQHFRICYHKLLCVPRLINSSNKKSERKVKFLN